MEIPYEDGELNMLAKTQGGNDNTELGWLLVIWRKQQWPKLSKLGMPKLSW